MPDKSPQLAHRILSYLVDNPNAQDTLEGIVEWWLLERFTKTNVAVVQAALGEFVSAGLLLQRRGKDSRTYYKINRRKLKKISTLLKEKD